MDRRWGESTATQRGAYDIIEGMLSKTAKKVVNLIVGLRQSDWYFL